MSNEDLRDVAINNLLASCNELLMAYPRMSVPVLSVRYYLGITYMCDNNFEQLKIPKKTSNFTFGVCSIFSPECQTIQNSYKLCNKRWKYNLLNFTNKVILLKLVFCLLEVKAPDCSFVGNTYMMD